MHASGPFWISQYSLINRAGKFPVMEPENINPCHNIFEYVNNVPTVRIQHKQFTSFHFNFFAHTRVNNLFFSM